MIVKRNIFVNWLIRKINLRIEGVKYNKVVDHLGILNLGKNYFPPTFLRLNEEEFKLSFNFD